MFLTWLPTNRYAGLRAVCGEVVGRPGSDVLNHKLRFRSNGGGFVGRRALVHAAVGLHQPRNGQVAPTEAEPARRQWLPVFLQISRLRCQVHA